MTIPTLIHFVRKVALYVSTAAVNSGLAEWQHGYCDEQKEGFERRRKISSDTSYGKRKKKSDVCRKFGLLHTKAQIILKTKTEIVSVFEQSG